MLTWSPSVDRDALVASGHELVEFSQLCSEISGARRRAAGRRESLANPAQEGSIASLERASSRSSACG
jgi:hypothetical protein